jgi:hypothetical protein
MTEMEGPMLEPLPYDARHHRTGTVSYHGRCSWHGVDSCTATPVLSFQDRKGRWQARRLGALEELTSRGEMIRPARWEDSWGR